MGRSKEERNQSKSSPQDPKLKGEERLSLTLLISQENPVTEINRFKGNRPEWLVLEETPFVFGRGQDFERDRGK